MSRLVAVATLTALVAGPPAVTAQRPQGSWSPEFGVQGGFSRIKPSGTGRSDQGDFFDLPGFTLLPLFRAAGFNALYAVIPVKGAVAVEASFFTSQGSGLTLASAGARGDFAITPGLYVSAGGTLGFGETGTQHTTQLGVQAAVGYRLHIAGAVNGRVEANWQSTSRAGLEPRPLPPWNSYSLLFGISSRLTGGSSVPSLPSSQAAGRSTAWRPAIGVQGGYQNVHFVGLGDASVLSFPGWGSGLTASPAPGINVLSTAPTLYLIVPLGGGGKLAVEPGMDLHRGQSADTTVFSANTSWRLDYLVSGGWYAAGGLSLHYIKASKGFFPDPKISTVSIPGVNLGWGYRFHLSGEVAGRVEINYTMFNRNTDLSQATNIVGLMVGAAMPLN